MIGLHRVNPVDARPRPVVHPRQYPGEIAPFSFVRSFVELGGIEPPSISR